MKIRLFALSILMLMGSLVFAQYSPVKWNYHSEKINANEFNLIFTAEIDGGWYVYSQFLDDGGPIPTSFTFTENNGIELIGTITETGDNKKENFDELFGMQLIKYGGEVKFTQRIKVNAAVKSINGYLTYMTCNNESCLPPKDIDFELNLN
ncbi:MAG: hypothetical protein ACI8P3_001015 [Saprospiraceae bacterium]|jgi:hypothetical protein